MKSWSLALAVAIVVACGDLRAVHGSDASSVCTSYKYHYSCAIRESDLRVRCWHHNTGEVREGPLDQQFLSISCKGRELCGVLHDGSLATTTDLWPDATGMPRQGTTPRWDAWRSARVDTRAGVHSLACERSTTCIISGVEYTSVHTSAGKLVCWGDRGPAFFEANFPDTYKAVAVSESGCLEEGSCSEEDYATRASPICAIKHDGTLVCCCGSPSFMANVPDASHKFVDVSVSDKHGCGVLEEGGIMCWGDAANGKLLAPSIPNGSGGGGDGAIRINTGGGIVSDSLVLTETNVGAAVGAPTGDDVAFVSVSVTTDVSCGLLWNGVSVCWSGVTDNALEVSWAGCPMQSIATDGYVTCGRLLAAADAFVPPADVQATRTSAAVGRTHSNVTWQGPSGTGVFCWQTFPLELVGLERAGETWELEERRVPLDIRPPLHTLAVCMGLPSREDNYNRTRGEALAITLALCAALAFSVYRIIILKRFGDFSWATTVADHLVFWFGFFSGLFDLCSQALFVFMDVFYVSFRTLYVEAEQPYVTLSIASIVLLSFSFIVFLYTSWAYASDEFSRVDLRSPMAIAKRRFAVSLVVLLVLDAPQMIILAVYTETMADAQLMPSVTAIFSAVCCCVGPVYMVIKNYFRAKHAPAKPVDVVQEKDNADIIFGDLAKRGAGAFGQQQPGEVGSKATPASAAFKKKATATFLAHKMFGKPAAKYQKGSPARVAPLAASGSASFRRHQPPGGLAPGAAPRGANNGSAIIAAMAAKQTQAKIQQLANATTMKNLLRKQPERRRNERGAQRQPRGRSRGLERGASSRRR